MSKEDVNLGRKLTSEEKIGFFKRKIGPAYLGDFWQSKDFHKFLKLGTGLDLEFRSSQAQSYGPGDYSLLHSEEDEKARLVVVMILLQTGILNGAGMTFILLQTKIH